MIRIVAFSTLALVLIAGPGYLVSGEAALKGSELEGPLLPFIEQTCVSCHGPDKTRGGLRLDRLTGSIQNERQVETWRTIHEQIALGLMPPEDYPRPDGALIAAVLQQIRDEIASADARGLGSSETVYRRLNRREYRYTISDMLGLDLRTDDPTVNFPGERVSEGFDNLGKELVTSGYLLGAYLGAADVIIEKALVSSPRPEAKVWDMLPPFDTTNGPHTQGWIRGERGENLEYQSIFQGTMERFGYRPLKDLLDGAPHDGFYRVRVRASAHFRNHEYDPRHILTDPVEPLRMALVSGSSKLGAMHINQPGERVLASFDIPDDEADWREATVWLDEGFQPRLTYQNGPYNFLWIARYFHELYPESGAIKLDFTNWPEVIKSTRSPRIRIFQVQVEGPLVDEWPPRSHQILMGGQPFSPERTPEILESFATRAFRRPVRTDELGSFLRLVGARIEAGDDELTAMKLGLKAILCAPQFLYLDEGDAEEPDAKLNEYAFAARLSYFLWSSAPDDELLGAARGEELADPAILQQQVTRMLADPRAQRLTQHFPERWLGLYKLGSLVPDKTRYKQYYVHKIENAMREETRLFFADVLKRNLPPRTFLHSTYSIVNRQLARHYGFLWAKDSLGQKFERVEHPRNQFRGGLLGQASVMTVSADGVETSPVLRGIWVLETLLGVTPSPPPPDTPALSAQETGTATIREQLQRHSADPTCFACHESIDPLGFPLEVFDAVGRRRATYKTRPRRKIDSSGLLPDGTQVANVAELRQALLAREPQFIETLTEQLLTYALGRTLSIGDRQAADQIASQLQTDDGGLRDLIDLIVTSEVFARP